MAQTVSNWGNYPVTKAEVARFASTSEAQAAIAQQQSLIPRGLGRCYGDSSLAPHILSTLQHNRFLHFDPARGLLRAQSGLSLAEILDVVVPAGWFLPVTPGTKFVTLGGAIAADVHGKNHHSEGSFSHHVDEILLLSGQGEVLRCSRTENADIFWATCGGMGLTGLILEVSFRLKPIETAYIVEEVSKVKNVEELYARFDQSKHFTYSVAWIDCLAKGKSLGKGILYNGEHAKVADLQKPAHKQAPLVLPKKGKISIPFNMPSFTINPLTVKAFNMLFYGKVKSGTFQHIVDYDTYFYPLDSLHHWNRVYGKKGFAQYQFAIPPSAGLEGMVKILEAISAMRLPSFISVLKYFGDCPTGMLGFPMEGYMLAMDFPMTAALPGKLDKLDDIVLGMGGRLYLTKDSRMSARMFQGGYPRLDEFRALRGKLDPEGKFASLQSRRLGV